MNTKIQNDAIRKHGLSLRRSPVWWLSLILAAFLLSCFPEQLAEYLASQDACAPSQSGERLCKHHAAKKVAKAASTARDCRVASISEASSSAREFSLSGFTNLDTLIGETSPDVNT